jgi:pimeloyl-ACP methyl ester carboxylesterase
MKRNFFISLVLIAAALTPFCGAQARLAWDWQGMLSVNGGQLHIVLHIAPAKDGSLSVTVDNPDQGQMGVAADAVSFKDSKIRITMNTYSGVYEGTVDSDASEITGTWTADEVQDLNFKRVAAAPAPPKPAASSKIDGTWLGSLDTGAIKLRIVFKIASTAEGLSARLQSPDQSPAWMPATSATRQGSAISITLKELGVVFEGKIADDANSIDGTFTQMGNLLALSLKRIKDQAELDVPRPQNPVKPYPYRQQDVTYVNKAAGDTLAATITLPPGKGPFPAVLLIAGSGPHDRDESLLGHKPFLVLSDYLTRKGIVVLRADKRGVGKSTGEYEKATTADFAADAEAGVAYLKSRPEVDPHKIGLVGHSEGAIIAPMAAVAHPDVAFIVMMAGSGVPGDQIVVEQGRLIAIAGGESKEKADEDAEKQRETFTLVETEKNPAALERLLGAKLATEGVPDAGISAEIKAVTSPWFRFFLTYDPATALRKLTIPVLDLNGSLDLQVPPAQNLPAIRKALAGNKHAEVDELPGLNHLFQTAKTGSPAEYGQIEETMAPVALDKIAGWIMKQ